MALSIKTRDIQAVVRLLPAQLHVHVRKEIEPCEFMQAGTLGAVLYESTAKNQSEQALKLRVVRIVKSSTEGQLQFTILSRGSSSKK
mmetsp:Transcript_81590/g.161991  ORF Transcript_81590/g.161991 Transcript_81590/m.161991 type:complete len:87 (-) Transcript_81590:1751-2011(-)